MVFLIDLKRKDLHDPHSHLKQLRHLPELVLLGTHLHQQLFWYSLDIIMNEFFNLKNLL